MNLKISSSVQRVALIALVAVSLFFQGCRSGAAGEKNPYGLDLVTTTREYQESVKADSSNLLVDLEKHIPGIVLDVRYADTNNFTHTKIYTAPKAYLRKAAADSLLKIQNILAAEGLGLKIFDAYRPYAATLYFYEVYPDTTFVAAPWKGSIHNRGCAVDLTLIELASGRELVMPTPFDEFSEKAGHNYPLEDTLALKNRALLLEIMTSHGFTMYEHEWWHYNLKERDRYKLMNISFEELEKLQ